MPTQLQKLDPRYTVHLRGVDDFGAMAAITGASADGFTVTGVFRDAADFAVMYIYDADDYFGHPFLKYLPDFDLSGLVLSFDLSYSPGLQPIDSDFFPTIDWPYLDAILSDETSKQVSLFANATQVSGNYIAAQTVLEITTPTGACVVFDRVTIWYQNYAYDFNAVGGETAAEVAAALAAAINRTDWAGAHAISAVASGSGITVTSEKAGLDGNFITLYTETYSAGTLSISPDVAPLTGGSSAATWNIVLNFSELGLASVRQLWLTFAPALAVGAAYETTEWTAVLSNWSLTGAGIPSLQVAGPGSVRVEENDPWCTLTGGWSLQASDSFSKGFAQASFTEGDSATVKYHCQSVHDLYVGLALYEGYGTFGVSLDGDAQTLLSSAVDSSSQVFSRRLVRSGVAAGPHVVVLTNTDGGTLVFDFIEAAVPSDVPDAPGPWTDRSPALDYDTIGYLLSPTRLLWLVTTLGYSVAELNLYMGVFWFYQKARSGGTVPSILIDFSQTTYSAGPGFGSDCDSVFLSLSGEAFGKTIFPAEVGNPQLIAAHFAYYFNEVAAGVYATVDGSVLTLTLRAVGSSYNFSFAAYVEHYPSGTTTLAFTGSLEGGTLSAWVVDPTQSPAINVAAAAWMTDLFERCAAHNLNCVVSYSMELCFPPDAWVACFPDGTRVTTATGFGTISSSQCVPSNAAFLAYQQSIYLDTAALMQGAGLAVILQCGEHLWWYFPGSTAPAAPGMAFYDASTSVAAMAALGRPLHVFLTPNDDPSVNGYADANFLRGRLLAHEQAIVAAVKAGHPGALVELLYPYDVLYPLPAGAFKVGGRLNNYVSTPAQWQVAGAVFDRMKIEALDRDVSSFNVDLARIAMQLPVVIWNWPPGLVRYLIGVYVGGATWQRCLLAAESYGFAEQILFAIDQVCTMNLELGDPVIAPAATVL